MKRARRIVILTNKTARGAQILRQMKLNGFPISAIIIDEKRWDHGQKGYKVKRTLRRLGIRETIPFVVQRVRQRFKPKKWKAWKQNEFYRRYSHSVHTVENVNNRECEDILRDIEPDLIILGGARIIRRNIIAVPRIGILNAHPGLLPHYRGVDVIPWAIYNGDPVGVTIHFIDEGVDTGAIVAREMIGITADDTLGSLRNKANVLAGKLICAAVQELLETGKITSRAQLKGEGRQYYRMPGAIRLETERRLRFRANATDSAILKGGPVPRSSSFHIEERNE